MPKRRSLISGLTPSPKADPRKEEEFVYGRKEPARESAKKKPRPQPEVPSPPPAPAPVVEVAPEQLAGTSPGRSPLTTRLRSDLATALKRASLERQLAGQAPNTVQDILEEALEPWLKEHGYLK